MFDLMMNGYGPPRSNDRANADPLDILAMWGLEEEVVQMVREFGVPGRATALLERIFFADGDFSLVWDTQYAPTSGDRREVERADAMRVALLMLFFAEIEWTDHPSFEEPEHQLFRWRHCTASLVRLDEMVRPIEPWLYGWALLGLELYLECEGAPEALWNPQLASAVAPGSLEAIMGCVEPDELPWDLEGLVEGYGMELAREIEMELVDTLLHPERHRRPPRVRVLYDRTDLLMC